VSASVSAGQGDRQAPLVPSVPRARYTSGTRACIQFSTPFRLAVAAPCPCLCIIQALRFGELERLFLDQQSLALVLLAARLHLSTTAASFECLRARRVSAASPERRNTR
jgi:hypothetical protein